MIDLKLLEYADDVEEGYLRALHEGGNFTRAGELVGVNRTTIMRAYARVKDRASIRGYSPNHDMTKPVPVPFAVKRVSQNYVDGELKQQWVISSPDQMLRYELIRKAFQDLSKDVPRLDPKPFKGVCSSDLLTLYTLTDSHVGMQAWGKETGDDWDLKIAEDTLVGCFKLMIENSPPSETCVISQLGDFLHYDGLTPVTPTHGHVLDADGRYSKMVKVAIRILRRVISLALEKHKIVHVVMAEGNHDLSSSVWLRHMFSALYENEPRVEINDRELPYYVYEFGKVMLGWSHGHLAKKEKLPLLFATEYPQIWGRTTKRYIHCGHQHHVDIKEHMGATVIQHTTLAARDAHAARGGWHSNREVSAITYHRSFGRVGETVISPEMLLAA